MKTPAQERMLDPICRVDSVDELRRYLKFTVQGLNSRVINFEELKKLFGLFDKKSPEEFNRLPFTKRLSGLTAIRVIDSRLAEKAEHR